MSRRRLTFQEWKARLLRCAKMMREGATSRELRKEGYGMIRYAYALVCHVANHPATRIEYADYETYYLSAQCGGERMRKRRWLGGPMHRLGPWTHKRLMRYKERPATCSPVFWRIHLDWRKRHKHYATIPENPVSPAKGEP